MTRIEILSRVWYYDIRFRFLFLSTTIVWADKKMLAVWEIVTKNCPYNEEQPFNAFSFS